MINIGGAGGSDHLAVFHHADAVGQIKHVMQVMADQENPYTFSL